MLAGIVYITFFSSDSLGDMVDRVLPGGNDENQGEEQEFNIITKDQPKEPQKVVVTPDKRVITVEPIEEPNEADEGKVTKDDLVRMSGSFAERFGSYSNQSNFANILDLKIFMSERMKYWADNFIKDQNSRAQDGADIYYGITTKSIAKELKEFDEDIGLAKILVQTRRREATGASSNYSNIYNQNILITFVKENGAWKVDSAHWIN